MEDYHGYSTHTILRTSCLLLTTFLLGSLHAEAEFAIAPPPEGSNTFSIRDDVCMGDIDVRNDPRNLKFLDNCRVIEGSLSFVLIDHADPRDYQDLSYPKLREITGFFLAYRVTNLTSFSQLFPNLAVIGGEKLMFNYALVIYEMYALETIGLKSLTRISRGAIRIEKNFKLCYIDTIDWDSIMNIEDKENNIVTENKRVSECANHCPGMEKQRCRKMLPHGSVKALCWSNEDCQRICSAACPHSCHTQKPDTCCHPECLGGCSGNSATHCVACKNFISNGTCVGSCPSGTVQIMNRYCILPDECPSHYKLFQGVCSEDCPTGYTNHTTDARSCAPCLGTCPKTCDKATVQSLTDMMDLEGCTIIDGSLTITLQGGENTAKKLETYLGLIEEIRGALVIIRAFSLITLSFLKNLRVIGGTKDLERGLYSVYVLDNRNLQDLFVTPHQNFSITRGKVFFHFNPKLCYHKIQEFAATGGLSANLSTGDVSRNTNGDFVACSALKINLTLKAVGSIILVTWQEDKVGAIADRRSILGFVVSWRVADKNVTQFDGEESCGGSLWDSTYTEPSEYQLLLPGLNAATRYAMYVRSYMISGTENGVKSDIKYIVTPERAPSAPTSLLIQAVSSSKLRVMWGPPDEPNGNVTRYKLKWTKQVDASYGSVDFCIGKIPNSNPREDTTTERTDIIEEWDGDCNCSCEGGKDLKDADEVRNQITFENALHNIIFIKSYYLDDILMRPQRSKREVDSTQSPVGNVVIDDKSSSPNTTVPSQTDSNGTTAAANVSDTRPVVNEAEVIMNDEFMILDLGHFEQIMVEVVACNLEGCSEQSTVVFGRTLPKESADDIVSGIALNITDQKIKEHVILARWEPPPQANGVVLKYEVEVSEEVKPKTVETVTLATASPEAGINSTSQEQSDRFKEVYCISAFAFTEAGGFTFTLRNSGNFSVRVRAVTLAGNGNWTRPEPLNVPSIDEVLPQKAPIVQQIPWIVGALAFIILGVCLIVFFRYQYRKDQTPDVVLYASANPEYFSTNDMYVPDDWEFPREKLTVVNELGKGGFGMVYEGIAQEIIAGEEKTTVAVKSVQANASVRDRIEFLNEASVMKNIKTHHVVHLLGVVSKGQPTYVIMEFMMQGDLKNWLRARRPENQQDLPLMERKHPPTYPEVIKMAAEIADGMAYLGANKYVHRDLSARNCLVSEDGTCKVADFGLARDIYQSDYYRKERGGMLPIRWMAPESVKDGVFTTSSDVWSYGILLWEIASLGEMPYGGLNNEGAGEFVKQGRVLNMPEGCPEKLQELMMACWTFQEKLRPTFSDIVQSLESTGFLPLNFPLVSFFHGQERVVEQSANGSLEELERVNMLPQPGMNDYTYMDKGNPDEGNRFPRNGLLPVNGSIPGHQHGSPVHASSSLDQAGQEHGSPQIGKCTEC